MLETDGQVNIILDLELVRSQIDISHEKGILRNIAFL